MKVLFLKRKVLSIVLLVAIISGVLGMSMGDSSFAQVYFGDSGKKYPIYRVATESPKVAISFDAAWGADKTEQIMAVCEEFGIKATFFLVGFWVEKYPELTRLIYDNGFEIGSHSFNHPDMTKLSESQMRQELESTNATIEGIIDGEVRLFRPPFGAYNNTLVDVVESMNMRAIQWDVDTLDWKGYNPSQVIDRVTKYVQNGSIILCHNNADYVVENTRLILTTLQNKGYEFVTVGELVQDVQTVKIGVGYTS